MSRFHGDEPIAYTIPGDCRCPGTPHPDGDVVQFRAHLSPRGGAAALAVIREAARNGVSDYQTAMDAELGYAFMRTEIVSWTFRDDKGQPVPVTRDAIDGLDWATTGYYLSDKATELYGDEALAPLVSRLSESSSSGQTDDSTSASSDPTPKHPKPSTRSSQPASAGSRRSNA